MSSGILYVNMNLTEDTIQDLDETSSLFTEQLEAVRQTSGHTPA